MLIHRSDSLFSETAIVAAELVIVSLGLIICSNADFTMGTSPRSAYNGLESIFLDEFYMEF
jgi:hypothetical protein